MVVQTKHRFSVEDYYRMAETGVLRPNARVELLNGEITDMSPIGPLHGGVVAHLNQIFNEWSRKRWLVFPQNALRLDDFSVPQPDIMLLKPRADYYRRQLPEPDDVLLLIEVSDSTLEADRLEKLPAYGRAGIAEVWIVNLNESVIEVYRDPQFTGFGTKTLVHPGQSTAPLAFPDVAVAVAELFR